VKETHEGKERTPNLGRAETKVAARRERKEKRRKFSAYIWKRKRSKKEWSRRKQLAHDGGEEKLKRGGRGRTHGREGLFGTTRRRTHRPRVTLDMQQQPVNEESDLHLTVSEQAALMGEQKQKGS